MKQINIFVGHFGSGKTEVALNFAIQNKVDAIFDLDTVNPYFRTNDAKKALEEKGIKVIAPQYAGTNVDIPALPPEVYSAFTENKISVLDVGGDDDGAYVLGRFKNFINDENSNVYMVVNVFRPETDTPEKILEMARVIESASRLKVNYIINNSNLMELTERKHIEKGEEVVKEASRLLGIPFHTNAAMKHLAKEGEIALDKHIIML